jgi:hypothetical protein
MTTELIINVTDYSGGGSPPGSDPAGAGLYLPDAYEATAFFAVIEFLIQETIIDPETGEETITVTPVSSVTSDFDFAAYNMTYTQINNYTVRLDGPILNVFTDQYYQFVLSDMSTPILPFDTEEEFYSLIKYQKPSANTILFEYSFLVDEVFDTAVYQWINWKYETAVNNITSLSTKGTL